VAQGVGPEFKPQYSKKKKKKKKPVLQMRELRLQFIQGHRASQPAVACMSDVESRALREPPSHCPLKGSCRAREEERGGWMG
jgi:hypothetical protein